MIKSIITPVDFSTEASTALMFAAEISKRASAKLTILHALQGNQNEEDAKQQMGQLVASIKQTFGTDLFCDSQVVAGDLLSALHTQIGIEQPDLIVMGTKGASGLKKILIGSNTVKVLATIKVPTLIIPETVKFEVFIRNRKNRVVLATDLEDLTNDSVLNILEGITSLMINPKLRILNVRPKNTSLSYHQNLVRSALVSGFKDLLETEPTTVFSNMILDGINFYLHKNDDTGLIVMIGRDSGGLFQKNFTLEMASITEYPLLVLSDHKS